MKLCILLVFVAFGNYTVNALGKNTKPKPSHPYLYTLSLFIARNVNRSQQVKGSLVVTIRMDGEDFVFIYNKGELNALRRGSRPFLLDLTREIEDEARITLEYSSREVGDNLPIERIILAPDNRSKSQSQIFRCASFSERYLTNGEPQAQKLKPCRIHTL